MITRAYVGVRARWVLESGVRRGTRGLYSDGSVPVMRARTLGAAPEACGFEKSIETCEPDDQRGTFLSVGWGLLFGSLAVLLWFLVFFVFQVIYMPLNEERGLEYL